MSWADWKSDTQSRPRLSFVPKNERFKPLPTLLAAGKVQLAIPELHFPTAVATTALDRY
jgi:hypothetical protein